MTTICRHYCYCCGVHEWSPYEWRSVMNVDGWSIKSNSFWDLDGNEHWTSWFMYRFDWIIAVVVMLHPALSCTCNPHMNCSRPFPFIWWCVHHAGLASSWAAQIWTKNLKPIGSMYAIYGNIYQQYNPNVSIYTIHGSFSQGSIQLWSPNFELWTTQLSFLNSATCWVLPLRTFAILDEATSALDCSNQEAMYSNLKRPVLCWSLLSLLAPDQLQEFSILSWFERWWSWSSWSKS